ncbi:MAG: NAD(P)H-hydrate dehydratase [Candidatus Magasanikbacteria bacterium CG_4_10_14_0_2_um_filter_37_12]|uniref:ADP-dependent (S)-NAD(P)H-hydrate dehydratase n=1 Tax=Candidatus Magasanikbacteria bacterium CG_4_10_14_0_2_um_filter_37_12 TaxID=1974637 RepID=A0A2M7V783_9BACT|nr:MAG: NAD(P)H-hydrate dehydratase [Candidatus Magasanikbacteria bacterium CG_4_10_14_0_2_um_filter_37_12]
MPKIKHNIYIMQILDQSIFGKLKQSNPDSHKGQNGRLLVIAGSAKFHGALLLSLETASRIVDMVYVHSTIDNLKLIKKLRSEISTFIAISRKKLFETIEIVDSILIGPGLSESSDTIALVHDILHKYPNKKTIIDATALWHVKPSCLHSNCILTPHSREFTNVFECEATAENVEKMAQKYHCTIVLTGKYDYISNGEELWENRTGHVGMTKGGTGDVLSSAIAGLSATNDLFTATLASTYLVGLVGEKLAKEKGTFYNAEDLINSFGGIWGEFLK